MQKLVDRVQYNFFKLDVDVDTDTDITNNRICICIRKVIIRYLHMR
jgi:hypothetical protein